MESLLTRFRHLTVLLVVLVAQLILLAYQVKMNQDVRLIRVWSVSAVTPLARLLESIRSNTVHFVDGYLLLAGVEQRNRQLESELGRLKRENRFLKAELGTADRARALLAFQSRTPSRTIAARVIGTGTAGGSRVVFVDRGSMDGVRGGMAVITADGIAGRIQSVYPQSSQVLLVTDVNFAAGVVSQKNRVEGTLKGQGRALCYVDYLQNEQRVEKGEWFYTSGDDRLFPRGLPVGSVTSVQPGPTFKAVLISPAGLQAGLEEVLIVLEGVHAPVPEPAAAETGIQVLPPPPSETLPSPPEGRPPGDAGLGTDADRLREHYRRVGEAQGHVFGEGVPGARPPDFNVKPPDRVPPPETIQPPAQQPRPQAPANRPPATP